MKILDVPFSYTEWMNLPEQEHKGETGTSKWRIFEKGNIRVRLVDYSKNFRSDHWCERGHVLYVLKGELTIELKGGQVYVLSAGSGFQTSCDDSNPHLAYTRLGARVFIVD